MATVQGFAFSRSISLPATLKDRLVEEKRSLRVEILECSGGQGHKKSAEAMRNAVKAHFEEIGINVTFNCKDVGSHMFPDPFGKGSLGKYKIIDFHNYLACHGMTKLIKLSTVIAKSLHKIHFPFNVKYFNKRHAKQSIRNESPDLIISAVPFVNGPLLKSVKGKGIPVLVVATDADNALFSVNWPKNNDLVPYRYCIPYNSLEITQKVNSAVDPRNLRGIGYPVRSEFSKSYSTEELATFRSECGIEADKVVIGIMMGGLGGIVTLKYFEEIAKGVNKSSLQNSKIHFTLFCGTNYEIESILVDKARKAGFEIDVTYKGEGSVLYHQSGASLSIVGFTKNVYKYMAVSKCWVTKPGSSSFNECLCMAVPMLCDNTSDPLPWEALNFDLAETYNFGERVTKLEKFIEQLNTILDPEKNKEYHDSMVEFRKDRLCQKDFSENIVKLTYELLNEAEEVRVEKQQVAANNFFVDSKEKRIEKLSFLSRIKGAGRKIVSVAKKVYQLVVKILLLPIKAINWMEKMFLEALVDFGFFSGFNLDATSKLKRRSELLRGIRHTKNGTKTKSPHKARPIEGEESPLYSTVSKRPIDALYFKSEATERTGNAVIYVLGKDYQDYHPKNYDHILDDGADVILFNPSENTVRAMAEDLKTLIYELKKRNPEQKLLLHGYSVGAHVAAGVASDIASGEVQDVKAESFPVIVDRGYGDGYELVKRVSLITSLSYSRKYINEYHNDHVLKKIEKHQGAMLFLTAKDGKDPLTHLRLKRKKIKNLTKELRVNHRYGINKLIELQNADHWTPWTYRVHNEVKEFMKNEGIVRSNYIKFDEQNTGSFPEKTKVPWAREHILPLFI